MYGAQSGYQTDGDAGLSQVGARYYDAQVGRFITRDTELDQAPYLYCDHDPINATDSSGHNPILIGIGVVVVIGGAYWWWRRHHPAPSKPAPVHPPGFNDGDRLGNGGRGTAKDTDFNNMMKKWDKEKP